MDPLHLLALLTLIVQTLSASFDEEWYTPENKSDFPRNILVKEFSKEWTTLEYNAFMKPLDFGFLKTAEAVSIKMSMATLLPYTKNANNYFGFKVHTTDGTREGVFALTNVIKDVTVHALRWKAMTGTRPKLNVFCYAKEAEMSVEAEFVDHTMQQFWCLDGTVGDKKHFAAVSAWMGAAVSNYEDFDKTDDEPQRRVIPATFFVKNQWDFVNRGLFWKFPTRHVVFPAKSRPEPAEPEAPEITIEVLDWKKLITWLCTALSIFIVCITFFIVTFVLIMRYRAQRQYAAAAAANRQ
uniref:L-type lectin-like domain-containing protein n=1 Tax=Panagrellus redivivus TaxID=6233 RepID=A0A7E4VIZ4_PANRE